MIWLDEDIHNPTSITVTHIEQLAMSLHLIASFESLNNARIIVQKTKLQRERSRKATRSRRAAVSAWPMNICVSSSLANRSLEQEDRQRGKPATIENSTELI